MRTSFVLTLGTLALAIQAQDVSKNGLCAGDTNLTCKDSRFGACCSKYGYCGSGPRYCGDGCNRDFGYCDGEPPAEPSTTDAPTSTKEPEPEQTTTEEATSSTEEAPTSTEATPAPVSTDARCGFMNGAENGQTCLGSKDGDCCSKWSYCGRTDAYCGAGCQSEFGTCA